MNNLNLKQLYLEILDLQNYIPSDKVNNLFSELVSNVVSGSIDQNLTKREIDNLQKICSSAEYQLEKYWSKKIIQNSNSQQALSQFPYYENYQKLTTLEWSVLQSCVYHKQHDAVLFIGGGPLPMTAIVLAQNHGIKSTILDIDAEAVKLSTKLISNLKLNKMIMVVESSGEKFQNYHDYKVIYVAALAGSKSVEKKKIFDQIKLQTSPGTHIVARSSHGKRKILYAPLDTSILEQFQKVVEVHPHNDIVNSFFLFKNPDQLTNSEI